MVADGLGLRIETGSEELGWACVRVCIFEQEAPAHRCGLTQSSAAQPDSVVHGSRSGTVSVLHRVVSARDKAPISSAQPCARSVSFQILTLLQVGVDHVFAEYKTPKSNYKGATCASRLSA